MTLKEMHSTAAFPVGAIIVAVPEPGDRGWDGEWRVWLGRNHEDEWCCVATCKTREDAVALCTGIADVIYPRGGHRAVERGPLDEPAGR